jgi:hypothetical protein
MWNLLKLISRHVFGTVGFVAVGGCGLPVLAGLTPNQAAVHLPSHDIDGIRSKE